MEKIEKGMEVYLSDKMMELNKMFIKKNGPYVVQDVFELFGTEMAHLLVTDPGCVEMNDYGIIAFPVSELYTKNANADNSKSTTLGQLHKSITESSVKLCPESFGSRDAFKEFVKHIIKTTEDEELEEIKSRYFYKLDNGKTVMSGERLYIGENILVSDDETNKYYINSIATYEIKLKENEEPDFTFVMSMDAIALDEALEWKIFSNNEKTKATVRKELNINTLKDLNEYDFITHNKLESMLVDKLVDVTGQPGMINVLRLKEAQELSEKAIEYLSKQMGYTRMSEVTWLYYKKEKPKSIKTAARRVPSRTE